MVKKSSKIQQLRATVKAQEKAAEAKIRRTLKVNGADIRGTKFDVTRPADKTKNYNSAQLKAYSEKLSGFMDRNKQWHGLANGDIATRGEVRSYKILEGRYNKGVNRSFDQVSQLNLPGDQDGTLQDRMMEMLPTRMNRASVAVNVAFKPPVRRVQDINGRKALDILTKDYERRIKPEYLQGRLDADRQSLIKTLMDAGMDARNSTPDNDVDLVSLVYDLTDKQFATVWQYTNIANAAFLNYESLSNESSGEGTTLTAKESDDTLAEVREALVWAKAL